MGNVDSFSDTEMEPNDMHIMYEYVWHGYYPETYNKYGMIYGIAEGSSSLSSKDKMKKLDSSSIFTLNKAKDYISK